MPPLRDIGDELYQLPPGQFTAARESVARQAKQAGDRERAAGLSAMKRPTVAAWLVNLITLGRRHLLDDLLSLGREIKHAQGVSTAATVRDLSARRRVQLAAAVAAAAELARAAGAATPSAAQLSEVEATLAAAMAQESVAELVLTGRLLAAVRYSGFGDPGGVGAGAGGFGEPGGFGAGGFGDLSGVDAGARAAQKGVHRDESDRDAADRRNAAREAAERQCHLTEHALSQAVAVEREAEDLVSMLTRQRAELESRLDEARQDARVARQARLFAEREAATATRRRAALES